MKQTVLSYQQNVYTACKLCNVVYMASLPQDRRVHEEHCKGHSTGKQPKMNWKVCLDHWKDLEDDVHAIMVVDCSGSKAWTEYAYSALEISYQDLGGPPIKDFKLWTETSHEKLGDIPRYKVYIYSVRAIVVGIVLAESIEQGGEYYKGDEGSSKKGTLFPDADAPRSEAYVSWDTLHPVFVCIDRIWVRSGYRKQGFATKLVDWVRRDFVTNFVLSKRQIAFSVPTDVGYEFASSYCKDVNFATGTGHKDASRTAFLVNPKDSPNVMIHGKLEENYADPRK
jgi:GNAT superfamily N-acetyltransferase